MASGKKHINPYDYLKSDTPEPSSLEKILDALISQNQSKAAAQQSAPEPAPEKTPAAPQENNPGKSPFEIEKDNAERAQNNLWTIYHGHNLTDIEMAREDVKNMVKCWGLAYIDNQEHYPLSREEKHVIRMDFYGTISEPSKNPSRHRITEAYLKLVSNPYRPQLPPQEYNLQNSRGWQVYAQFQRFRKIENDVIRQLQKMNIPAELIPRMNTYDFSDVLFQRFRDNVSESGNAHMFLGARQSFIKDFIRKNEPAFRSYLEQIGTQPRYIEELVRNMKKHGSTSELYIIDHAKGLKLLHHYKDKNITFPGSIGKRVTSEQIDFIRARGDFGRVALLDQNGAIIQPIKFSVHHKAAVNDAASGPYLAAVNNFENLCLTVDEPYHRFLHCLDITQTVGRRESYKARIYLDKDIVFMGGFHPDFQIRYDYSRDPKTIRQHNSYKRWLKQQQKTPRPPLSDKKSTKLSRKQKKRLQKKLPQEDKKQQLAGIINLLYFNAKGRD